MGYKSNFPHLMREAGFKLRQYRDVPLDWRLMGSYETERILREQNFELVDNALQHLSEAPLGTVLESHILDSGIAKYFIMSQYAIQYLLCCRTYLDEQVGELRDAHETSQQEIAKLRQSLSESNNEVIQLHKKITQIEAIREVVYPCHLCTKNFISNESLNIHIGRKHHVGTPTRTALPSAGGSVKDKDNDVHLINTIKMELEIKQLKERLNAAERNIRERGNSSRSQASPLQDQSTTTIAMRTVGIQSNLAEVKEKDELNIEAMSSDASERKEQLHGLAERLTCFETWQSNFKENNEQFIQDINHKLEDISQALEQTKKFAESKAEAAVVPTTTMDDRVTTPCLEDLERILTEKVTEIGKVSANKLEEVVHHLEIGYREKLEALERELSRLSVAKEPTVVVQHAANASKIPKPVPKKEETNMERIKRQVESEFIKTKLDDDTYSIEELPAEPKLPPQSHTTKSSAPEFAELPSGSSSSSHRRKSLTQGPEAPIGSNSGSHSTYTKQPTQTATNRPTMVKVSQAEMPENTDISESLSEEGSSDEGSELLTSEPERQVFRSPKRNSGNSVPTRSPPKPKQPLTRKDVRKLINQKLTPHGLNMKSKGISSTSLKRVSSEMAQNRNRLKLEYPSFYATRNRIRIFVEKLCSAKMPAHAQVLLKNKTPLQPMEAPKNKGVLLATTDEEVDEIEVAQERTSISQDEEEASAESAKSVDSSPQQKRNHREFRLQLEQMLAKPAAQVVSRPVTTRVQMHQPRPVPLPRKRVMFNTLSSSGKSLDDVNEHIK